MKQTNVVNESSSNNANMKFVAQVKKLIQDCNLVGEDICGMSVKQIMDGDFKTVANELYSRYCNLYAYGESLEDGNVRYKCIDIVGKNFNARTILAYVHDKRWDPFRCCDANYQKNKLHKILFKFKPGFQLHELTSENISAKETAIYYNVPDKNNEYHNEIKIIYLTKADIEKNGIYSLLTWMFTASNASWKFSTKNFKQFLTFAAGPILADMLVAQQYVDADLMKLITDRIVAMPGFEEQIKQKDNHEIDTDQIFMQQKKQHRPELKKQLKAKQLKQMAEKTLKKWEDEEKTFEEVSNIDNLNVVVGQMLGASDTEDYCYIDNPEYEYSNQTFDAEGFAKDLSNQIDDEIIDDMLEHADEKFNAKTFKDIVFFRYSDDNMYYNKNHVDMANYYDIDRDDHDLYYDGDIERWDD